MYPVQSVHTVANIFGVSSPLCCFELVLLGLMDNFPFAADKQTLRKGCCHFETAGCSELTDTSTNSIMWNDKAFVLALKAVKSKDWTLLYASEVLKMDREVVLEAVKNMGFALFSMPQSISVRTEKLSLRL